MKNNFSNYNIHQQNFNSLKDKINPDLNQTNPDTKDIGITLLNTNVSEPKLKREIALEKNLKPTKKTVR